MTTTMQFTESVQDGIVKAVETGQRWTLEAMKATTAQLDPWVPSMPAMAYPESLPTPKEALDSTFRFTEKLIGTQRSFLGELAELGSAPAGRVHKKAAS